MNGSQPAGNTSPGAMLGQPPKPKLHIVVSEVENGYLVEIQHARGLYGTRNFVALSATKLLETIDQEAFREDF